jgi:hypothetical protein
MSAACAVGVLKAAPPQASAGPSRRERVCLVLAIDRAVRIPCLLCLIANLFW